MITPKQSTRITAAEWRARYAEICKQYPTSPPRKSLTATDLDRIRQWEQFTYALSYPPAGRWRVVKLPTDPEVSFRALVSFVESLPALPICEI